MVYVLNVITYGTKPEINISWMLSVKYTLCDLKEERERDERG